MLPTQHEHTVGITNKINPPHHHPKKKFLFWCPAFRNFSF